MIESGSWMHQKSGAKLELDQTWHVEWRKGDDGWNRWSRRDQTTYTSDSADLPLLREALAAAVEEWPACDWRIRHSIKLTADLDVITEERTAT